MAEQPNSRDMTPQIAFHTLRIHFSPPSSVKTCEWLTIIFGDLLLSPGYSHGQYNFKFIYLNSYTEIHILGQLI